MISQRTRGLYNALLFCQSLLILLALWLSMKVAFGFITAAPDLDRYPIYGAVSILGLAIESLVRRDDRKATDLFQGNVFFQHGVALRQTLFVTSALFLYLAVAKDIFISRTVLAFDVPLLYVVLLVSNVYLPRDLAKRIFGENRTERALLIGPASHAQRLQTWLSRREVFGFRAVGILCAASEPGVPGLPWLGDLGDLERVLAEHQITNVILLELPESTERHQRLVEALEQNGIRILILSNLEEKLRHRTVHFEDDGLDFIAPRQEPLEDPVNRLLKRLLDVAVALPILVLVFPPLALVVWVLQRMQSPGPLFYRQIRAGLQNRRFTVLKFRSMHVNRSEAVQAVPGDARIFPAGAWLRGLSLDEIPQFWNVLTGEMSVCGPRPHLIEHNADFSQRMARYHVRTFVKPGITGLAQVRGFRGEVRNVEDIEHRLESDIEYLENWRLALDLVIIFRTGLQMLLLAGNGLIGKSKRASKRRVGRTTLIPPVVPLGKPGASLAGTRRGYVPEAFRRNFRQILGIRFFTGSVSDAVALGMRGGLVVAPAAPILLELEEDPVHRAAFRSSALALTDSGLMVFLWKLLTGEEITRVSGLAYLKLLIEQPQLRVPGGTFWVMPSPAASERNLAWLARAGVPVTRDDCYIAPHYGREENDISDPALVEIVRLKRPQQIIMAVGGGVQEKLGAYLLRQLDYRPAVHCTGAAIGFLSGEQVRIPMWADSLRLGWLFRCMSEPARFLPRYWEARKLYGLMLDYHGRLPGGDAAPATEEPAAPSLGTPMHPTDSKIGPLLCGVEDPMRGSA